MGEKEIKNHGDVIRQRLAKFSSTEEKQRYLQDLAAANAAINVIAPTYEGFSDEAAATKLVIEEFKTNTPFSVKK